MVNFIGKAMWFLALELAVITLELSETDFWCCFLVIYKKSKVRKKSNIFVENIYVEKISIVILNIHSRRYVEQTISMPKPHCSTVTIDRYP